MIPFGAFRPDVGGPNTGIAAVADSVLPQAGQGGVGYGPFPALTVPATAEALPSDPKGIVSVTLADGSYKVFAGTSTTIEEMAADFTWSSIATGLSLTSGDDWSFERFGAFLIATNTTDGMLAYNLQSPAGLNPISGAPAARYVFVCNNVVFALDCDGNNRRFQSSGTGDHTEWRLKGADGKTVEDGGALMGGVDLKNGAAVLFQENAMRLIQFGNAPSGALYSLSKIADGRGSVGNRSIVSFDGMVFYLATDGFYRFDLGGGNQPIGAEKINRWFLGRVDQAKLGRVQGAADPLNKMVWWRYPTLAQSSETVDDVLLGYDWQLGEWVTATVRTSALSRIATPGYTLDAMDDFGVLDDITTRLDDRFWQGGQPVFAALNADYKFGTFSGTPMAATLETSVMNNKLSGMITRVTPIDDAAGGTLRVGVKDKLDADLVWKTGESKGRGGRTPQRARGLNMAFRRVIPAGEDWTFANGVDHIERSSGGPV